MNARNDAVRGLLVHAARRVRLWDEHMFAVAEIPPAVPDPFRVQVFTAPGHRPVVIATQTLTERVSLCNNAEAYAAAVWREVLPQETEPPLW